MAKRVVIKERDLQKLGKLPEVLRGLAKDVKGSGDGRQLSKLLGSDCVADQEGNPVCAWGHALDRVSLLGAERRRAKRQERKVHLDTENPAALLELLGFDPYWTQVPPEVDCALDEIAHENDTLLGDLKYSEAVPFGELIDPLLSALGDASKEISKWIKRGCPVICRTCDERLDRCTCPDEKDSDPASDADDPEGPKSQHFL